MPKQNIPPILRNVCEYARVKRRTQFPELMKAAADINLPDSHSVHFLVSRMCIHLNITCPKIHTRPLGMNWASPKRYLIHIGLDDVNVEMVLHELAHLISDQPEPLGAKRKTYHGGHFVQTLDRLLAVWSNF